MHYAKPEVCVCDDHFHGNKDMRQENNKSFSGDELEPIRKLRFIPSSYGNDTT